MQINNFCKEPGITKVKENILIISHKEIQCGVHQYGLDIFEALKKSNVYDFYYEECSSPSDLFKAINQNNPKAIIYNYHPSTLPWLNGSITRQYSIIQLSLIHEVTQEVANKTSNEVFDGFLCPDPTLVENNKLIYINNRLIPPYKNNFTLPHKLTIGSFGFGFRNKGFERLINVVDNELKGAKIRLHIPFNDVVDRDGKFHALDTAERCRQLAKSKNIELEISHKFLEKNQLLDFIAQNTLNAFFYDSNENRGISSVTDLALAVQRPIAITKSGMFRHLFDASPSICIEDSNFSTIINNGIAPLVKFYNEWSEASFINNYEQILDKVLGKSENLSQEINNINMKEQNQTNTTISLIHEAEKFISSNEIDAARIILNEAVKFNSFRIEALIDLAVCDILQKNEDNAIMNLNYALHGDPKNQIALDNLEYILNKRRDPKIKISIVVVSRNDNFGGSLFETATATLQTMSKTFDEIILVDFGSFEESMYPTLNRTILEKNGNIRIVTVPRNWVIKTIGDDSTFADVLARNIGVRRATHDIIVSSNIDIIPGPIKYFDFSKFDVNKFYSSNKFMIERSMIPELRKKGLNWEEIQEYLFNTKSDYYRQPGFFEDPWSKVSGCGDFQIGHRKIWFNDEVRGFEETLIYKDHTDTNLHKKIIENAHYDVEPALFFYLFHQSHENIRGTRTCKQNDKHSSVQGFGKTTNPHTWGFSEDNFKEYFI